MRSSAGGFERPGRCHAVVALFVLAVALVVAACGRPPSTDDSLDDEAMQRFKREERDRKDGIGRTPDEAAREWFYPKSVENYFGGMDGIVASAVPVYQLLQDEPPAVTVTDPVQSYNEILGRNAWMIWSAGNEGFWDWLSNEFGFIDLLKLVDSRNRLTRFAEAGLINEPGMVQANGPVEDEFGLFLDQPADERVRQWRRDYVKHALAEPTTSAQAAPASQGLYTSERVSPRGVRYDPDSAYQLKIPPPEIYGLSSGVVGLRLFPNPKFDAKARAKWDAKKYYDDPRGDPEMIRPYRVGMSCAFCHASYHPLKPPLDLTNPSWENISGNIGAQYLRPRAVFANLLPKNNFVYHILDSQPPCTIDTSLIASDNVNNPNAMNSVFNLAQRAVVSMRNPKEKLGGAAAAMPSLWRHPEPNAPPGAPDILPPEVREQLAALLDHSSAEVDASNSDPRRVPRILFDGADSIGAWGALSRVYLNIGTNYEQWITLHNTVVGLRPQQPFTISGVQKHSIYWYATQLRVAPLRDYFLKVTPPMPLLAADGGQHRFYHSKTEVLPEAERRRRIDLDKLQAGRKVFAKNCIVCHSSIQAPERFPEMDKDAKRGEFWDHDPGQWLSKPSYVRWAEDQVETPDFWRANYLSTDYRIPVNLVQTNACRAMATNAVTGNMWEDFSSGSYRNLPSVGVIPFFNPYRGEHGGDDRFLPRHAARGGAPPGGGGPGFYRVPTLVSIWTTAPLLHNNSLGTFTNDPSIDGRLVAFDDAIRKLLWPERRLSSSSYNDATPARLKEDHGLIWRTTEDSYLGLPAAYLPRVLGSQSALVAMLKRGLPVLADLPKAYLPLPTAGLLLIAFVVLVFASHWVMRGIGYAAIVLALTVGLVVYLLNGALLDIRIGPIPKGTPVNLLANVNPDASPEQLINVVKITRDALAEIESTRPDPVQTQKLLHERVAPALMTVSKCPDFVMDRGHYFEWFKSMSDADKDALIELLKTF
jgi:mono/diheme cytochrome c family protein